MHRMNQSIFWCKQGKKQDFVQLLSLIKFKQIGDTDHAHNEALQ